MHRDMRILLACDRSGGHIFPALSVGKKLRENNDIYFFATSKSLNDYLYNEGFVVIGTPFNARQVLLEGFFRSLEALYIILRLRPRRIIGFGGRDSFFLILLGSLLFFDTAIYEPNIVFGKANKLLSFFVGRIFAGFDSIYKSKKTKVIGVILRDNIRLLNKAEARRSLGFDDRCVIFCFGGSQGSTFINKLFLKLIEELKGSYQIIHLTGKRDYLEISKIYNKIEKRVFVRDFYYAMEILYSASDLVISRAGASTLAEITYYKLPSILIPHPQGSGHQLRNAQYFLRRGAAFVLPQEHFSFLKFKEAVTLLLNDSSLREKMSKNSAQIRLGVSFEYFCSDFIS